MNNRHTQIYRDGTFFPSEDGGEFIPFSESGEFIVLPGLVDVHVHLREPGFCYKEDVASGTAAAKNGGFAAVCAMPNLSPVPDCRQNLDAELCAIQRSALVDVYPYGAITRGEEGKELSDLEGMADKVVAFSDDGRNVDDAGLMREAMERCKNLGKIIAAHVEDKSLANGVVREESPLNPTKTGISARAEWGMFERDLGLVSEAKCAYHVCHVSTKESVALIREAKKSGLDVTAETCPHYLTLTVDDIKDEGRFKMNPPLGTKSDREALLEGIADGTIDMISTDHAPHSAEEKSRGLKGSPFGIVGLETAFPVCFTALVLGGVVSKEKLVRLMSEAPAKRFGIDTKGSYAAFEIGAEYRIDSGAFRSKGRSTPFEGMRVRGRLVGARGTEAFENKKKEGGR